MRDDPWTVVAGVVVILAALAVATVVVCKLGPAAPNRVAATLGGLAAVLAAVGPVLLALRGAAR
jgi:hypothetical protein